MSNTDTEKRVVQMEFDNSKFDKNVKKSTKTLDDFEKKLEFKDVSSSLNVIKKGFSAFEIAAITAISNITTQVMNLGVRIVKSLSIDQISQGWQKFGDKTIAVATLAAQKIKVAGQELTEYEEKMEGINEQLEKMEWFTNETSYTFNDMVAALGKFTASGQDLDKSVDAMMGIATWASMSGANAQKASSAMTQLAQTLGRGYVLRIDWQSIQTLNMDTQMFREKVLETGVELGKLTKAGNDFISKTGAKINATNFTESLKSKWFTSEILVSTLEKYAAAVQDIYEISEKEGISARRVIEKYGASLDEFGVKAFKAAQETRTLNEALVYVFSTIGSTWSQSFEHLIGSYDEAKTLWSDLSDALYDSVIASNDFRNEILKVWEDLEGRKDLFKKGKEDQGAFWNIYDSIEAVKQTVKNAKNAIFPKTIFEDEDDQITDLGRKFKEYTQRLKESTARMKESVKENTEFYNILKGVFTVLKFEIQILQGMWNAISPIVDVLKWIVNDFFDRLSIFSDNLSKTEKITQTIMKVSDKLRNIIQNIIDAVNPKGILSKLYNFLENIYEIIVTELKPLETLEEIFNSFFEALNYGSDITEDLSKIFDGLLSILSAAMNIVKNVAKLLAKYVTPVIVDIVKVLTQLLGIVVGILADILGVVGDFFSALGKALEGNGSVIGDFKDNVFDFLTKIPKRLEYLGPILKSILNILYDVLNLILLIPKGLNELSKAITGNGIIENIALFFESLANAFDALKDELNFSGISGKGNKLFDPITELVKGIVEVFKGILSIISPALTIIGKVLQELGFIIQSIGDFLESLSDLDNYDHNSLKKHIVRFLALAALTWIFAKAILWAIDGIKSLFSPLKYLSDASDAFWDFAHSRLVGSWANLFKSIGIMLLEISAAFYLLDSVPEETLYKGLAVLVPIAALFVTLGTIILLLTKTGSDFTVKTGLFQKKVLSQNKTNTMILYSMASFIRTLGTSLLKVAVAFYILKDIDIDKLSAMGSIFLKITALISAVAFFIASISATSSKVNPKPKSVSALYSLGVIIGNLAKLMLYFSISLLILKNLEFKEMLTACTAMAILLGGITVLITAFNLTAGKARGGGNSAKALARIIDSISAVMISFTASLLLLSLQDFDKLKMPLIAMSTFMAALSVFILAFNLSAGKLGKDTNKSIRSLSKVFESIAKLMIVYSASVSIMALFTWDKLLAPIIALTALMAELIIMVSSLSKLKGAGTSIKTLSGIFNSISIVLAVYAASVMIMAQYSFAQLIAPILGLTLLLAGLIGVVAVMATLKKGEAILKKMPLVFLSLSATLIAMAFALKVCTQFGDQEKFVIGAASMAAMFLLIMGALAIVSNAGKPTNLIATGIAFLTLSAGLLAMTAAFKMMEEVEWTNIWKGLLMIGAGMLILAIGSSLGSAVLVFAAAMALLGVSIFLTAAGFALLSESLVAFCTAVVENESLISEGLKTAISGLIKGLLEGLIAGFEALLMALPELLTTAFAAIVETIQNILPMLASLIESICQFLTEMIPVIIPVIEQMLHAFLELIRDVGPDLISTVFILIESLLDNLVEHIPSIVDKLMTILIGIIDGIASRMPELLEAIGRLIKSIINGILEALEGLIPGIKGFFTDKVWPAITGAFEKVGQFFIDSWSKVKEWGSNLISKLKDGLSAGWEKVKNFFTDGIKKWGDSIKQGWNNFKNWGKDLIDQFKAGVTEAWNKFIGFFKDLWNGLKDWFKNTFGIHSPSTEFRDYGKYMMEGLEEGVSENSGDALGAVDEVAEKIKDGFTEEMDINSPSKVFKKYGDYMMQGLSNGIQEGSKEALTDIEDNTSAMIDTISKVADYVGANINDDDLTIRPVLDLSDVASGVSTMSSMLSSISGKGVSISSNLASDISKSKSKSEGSSKDPNGQVVNNNEGDNYYSTFNITASNPEEFARQADSILQRMRKNAKLANGGAR